MEEENENENSPESILKNISFFTNSLSSNPLFSCIITLYILFLLYFPPPLLKFLFSPVLSITLTLLLSLLRFGAGQRQQETQTTENRAAENEKNRAREETEEIIKSSSETTKLECLEEDHNWVNLKETNFEEKFVEWDVRAPLEVIYEEYYEGDDENNDFSDISDPTRFKYPSLSVYYPESDSDSSSESDFMAIGDWDSKESVRFTWEEDEREELIEISLDDGVNNNNNKLDYSNCVISENNYNYFDNDFLQGEEIEENNLIEIDISPAKVISFS